MTASGSSIIDSSPWLPSVGPGYGQQTLPFSWCGHKVDRGAVLIFVDAYEEEKLIVHGSVILSFQPYCFIDIFMGQLTLGNEVVL